MITVVKQKKVEYKKNLFYYDFQEKGDDSQTRETNKQKKKIHLK